MATAGGWRTVRKRWKNYFAKINDVDFIFYHIEDYALWIRSQTVEKHRLRTLWYLASGRAAAKHAVRDGCKTILINTFNYAAWMPVCKDVRYFVYGDASTRQMVEQQPFSTNRWSRNRQLPPPVDWLYKTGTKRLVRHGAVFLGMSRWYLHDLKINYGVPDEQLVELPFGVDLKLWRERNMKDTGLSAEKGLNILFIGAPFEAKGGTILQEIAEMPEFSSCRFHFIAFGIEFPDNDQCRYYPDLKADSDDLLEVFSLCDIMVLPTYADCSPHVAIEALAMGLPVIITNIGATADIVENGKTGRLITHPPDKEQVREKLLEYMNDKAMLEKESIAARKRAEEKFNIDIHMERLYNLLMGR